MEGEELIRRVVEGVAQSAQELLKNSKANPGRTLRELEEEVKALKAKIGAQALEAAVALQGEGRVQEGSCSCGGRWVFQGYRERQVMTSQGVIRVKRAYYTCDRCGVGIFPPGGAVANPGGME